LNSGLWSQAVPGTLQRSAQFAFGNVERADFQIVAAIGPIHQEFQPPPRRLDLLKLGRGANTRLICSASRRSSSAMIDSTRPRGVADA